MKILKTIIPMFLIYLTLTPIPSLAEESQYENIITQINQIKDYINQEMYLEAIELCNNTQYGGLNISPSDFTLLSNLKSRAQDGYDLYAMKLNSEMVDIERHNINYMILDGNYLEAIAKCDDILNNYKLLGDDIECIQMFKETAQECYDMYLKKFTYENVYDEILQIINYINDGLYIEATDECLKLEKEHNLSPEDAETVDWLCMIASDAYSEYLIYLESQKPQKSTKEILDEIVARKRYRETANRLNSRILEQNYKSLKGEGGLMGLDFSIF